MPEGVKNDMKDNAKVYILENIGGTKYYDVVGEVVE